jgi:formylglycine-generating enzyme required for sulfatase activity
LRAIRDSRANWHFAIMLSACALSCAEAPKPRPQLVVVIDTDAPTVAQGAADPTLSPAALMDTLSIELLGEDLAPIPSESRTLVLPEAGDWPVSLGAVPEPGEPLRLRLRLYRAGSTRSGNVAASAALLRAVAIDRVVELHATDDLQRVRVVLSTACLGKVPSLLQRTTCIDASRTAAAFVDGVASDHDSVSLVGTTPLARERPCAATPPPNAVCIPGGLTILGDASTYGLDDDLIVPSWPVRPVVVSPFFLDRDEMSVARFPGGATAPGTGSDCTFGGPNGALPVNCVSRAVALEACAALGGTLPSEAQWEHAARGRGRGFAYPWGSEFPTCCATRAECQADASCAGACGSATPSEVGSHADPAACDGFADVTPDGVRDLAGNLSELTLDRAAPYDHVCFGEPGLSHDPVCEELDLAPTQRGGSFLDSFLFLTSALRRVEAGGSLALTINQMGFRCAYPDQQ